MQKRIQLALVTFIMALGAYLIFTWGDQSMSRPPPDGADGRLRQFVSRPTTQATRSITEGGFTFTPGDETRVKVYDDVTGRLKYVFDASKWQPKEGSQTDFEVTDLAVQIHMPRGEITYIEAKEGEISLARRGGSRVEPRRGWLKGEVRVTIDRTTADWREAHPGNVERKDHPEELIKIFLADARFDLERAELTSEGDVLVDSIEARIEDVRGLTVQWDQVDNRIDALRFAHGGTMMLRRGGRMIDFGMPGSTREASPPSAGGQPSAGAAPAMVVLNRAASTETVSIEDDEQPEVAMAMQPVSADVPRAEAAAAEIRLEGGAVALNAPQTLEIGARPARELAAPSPVDEESLRSADALRVDVETIRAEARVARAGEAMTSSEIIAGPDAERRRVHTYRAVFSNDVLVVQSDGEQTIGKLEGDRLEINFDFGRKQRTALAGQSRPRPSSPANLPSESADAAPPNEPDPKGADPILPAEDNTRLTLTWNGPLDMRPLTVEPEAQSGDRFDAVATGDPVQVESQQGSATCDQLVYRHELRQVWLSGTERRPVHMAVTADRWLEGREVFFDQTRGLGRIDGPGRMVDERSSDADDGAAGGALSQVMVAPMPTLAPVQGLATDISQPADEASPRDPVEMKWTRGVDLELGRRPVSVIDPATGLRQTKQKEYLRRAWFHGDVEMSQGDSSLVGQEVAVTFGPGAPEAGVDQVAESIQHLNLSGDVRLQRGDEVLAGGRLDIEMTVAADGRNLPKRVEGLGDVLAKQGEREIRAQRMDVQLTALAGEPRWAADGKMMLPGRSRPAMQSIDARGDVYVRDPEQNLKISRADSLVAKMRNGNELVTAKIRSDPSRRYARARFTDVALHGHLIDIDMDRSAVDVPGPGSSYMLTDEDFSGRKLKETTVVKTTWTDRMQFRLAQDYGVFVGDVHSASDTFAMSCDKLTLRFGKEPPPPKEKKNSKSANVWAEQFWLLGALAGREADDERTMFAAPAMERKRPIYATAEGGAEAIFSEHMPAPRGQLGRLINRLRVAGDVIAADLKAQQMMVPCKGTLLIEDYQFDAPRAGERFASSSVGSPLMSSLRSDGPSQTMVAWENSMDFFVDRMLVVFDKEVSMVHRSGQQMVLAGALADAMRIDETELRHLGKGRRATLSCGNLLLEFRRSEKPAEDGEGPIRATDLERLIARDAVHFQETTKSLMGEHLQYIAEVDEVRLEGSRRTEARIVDQDERTQRLSMWRGPILIWDRAADRIEAPQATIRTSRR